MTIAASDFSESRSAVNICSDCPCTLKNNRVIHIGVAVDEVVMRTRSSTNRFRVRSVGAQNNKGMIPSYTVTFGQDFEYGQDRAIPNENASMGDNVEELIQQMEELREEVSGSDVGNLSALLMNRFTAKQSEQLLWSSDTYNARLSAHENIQHFMEAVLAAPGLAQRGEGKQGLHQALVAANMDISAVDLIDDLGVPALNVGRRGLFKSGDWANGLAFMVNGIQYVYVFVTDYCYSQQAKTYTITLEYHFFDVFGLDDADVEEYGGSIFDASQGVVAWWQLQHQYEYPPLLTRGITSRSFTVKI